MISGGDRIYLKSMKTKKYISVDGTSVKAASRYGYPFAIINLAGNDAEIKSGDTVYLETLDGTHLDHKASGEPIMARYKDWGEWQKFIIERHTGGKGSPILSDDFIRLRSHNTNLWVDTLDTKSEVVKAEWSNLNTWQYLKVEAVDTWYGRVGFGECLRHDDDIDHDYIKGADKCGVCLHPKTCEFYSKLTYTVPHNTALVMNPLTISNMESGFVLLGDSSTSGYPEIFAVDIAPKLGKEGSLCVKGQRTTSTFRAGVDKNCNLLEKDVSHQKWYEEIRWSIVTASEQKLTCGNDILNHAGADAGGVLCANSEVYILNPKAGVLKIEGGGLTFENTDSKKKEFIWILEDLYGRNGPIVTNRGFFIKNKEENCYLATRCVFPDAPECQIKTERFQHQLKVECYEVDMSKLPDKDKSRFAFMFDLRPYVIEGTPDINGNANFMNDFGLKPVSPVAPYITSIWEDRSENPSVGAKYWMNEEFFRFLSYPIANVQKFVELRKFANMVASADAELKEAMSANFFKHDAWKSKKTMSENDEKKYRKILEYTLGKQMIDGGGQDQIVKECFMDFQKEIDDIWGSEWGKAEVKKINDELVEETFADWATLYLKPENAKHYLQQLAVFMSDPSFAVMLGQEVPYYMLEEVNVHFLTLTKLLSSVVSKNFEFTSEYQRLYDEDGPPPISRGQGIYLESLNMKKFIGIEKEVVQATFDVKQLFIIEKSADDPVSEIVQGDSVYIKALVDSGNADTSASCRLSAESEKTLVRCLPKDDSSWFQKFTISKKGGRPGALIFHDDTIFLETHFGKYVQTHNFFGDNFVGNSFMGAKHHDEGILQQIKITRKPRYAVLEVGLTTDMDKFKAYDRKKEIGNAIATELGVTSDQVEIGYFPKETSTETGGVIKAFVTTDDWNKFNELRSKAAEQSTDIKDRLNNAWNALPNRDSLDITTTEIVDISIQETQTRLDCDVMWYNQQVCSDEGSYKEKQIESHDGCRIWCESQSLPGCCEHKDGWCIYKHHGRRLKSDADVHSYAITCVERCSCAGGGSWGNECTKADHDTQWCYLKNGLRASDCPGAVMAATGDKYWSEEPCKADIGQKSHGTCTVGKDGSPQCTCSEGWVGKRCEKDASGAKQVTLVNRMLRQSLWHIHDMQTQEKGIENPDRISACSCVPGWQEGELNKKDQDFKVLTEECAKQRDATSCWLTKTCEWGPETNSYCLSQKPECEDLIGVQGLTASDCISQRIIQSLGRQGVIAAATFNDVHIFKRIFKSATIEEIKEKFAPLVKEKSTLLADFTESDNLIGEWLLFQEKRAKQYGVDLESIERQKWDEIRGFRPVTWSKANVKLSRQDLGQRRPATEIGLKDLMPPHKGKVAKFIMGDKGKVLAGIFAMYILINNVRDIKKEDFMDWANF